MGITREGDQSTIFTTEIKAVDKAIISTYISNKKHYIGKLFFGDKLLKLQ